MGHLFLEIFIFLLYAGAIALAAVAIFWLPRQLFEFKRPELALIFVPAATFAVWGILSVLHVRMPGVVFISGHKALAGIAVTAALAWSWVEDFFEMR